MEKDSVTTVSEAVHKLQLALFNGIEDDNQLFAAGSLMSRSDYEEVVTERSIANLCGYPLCPNSLPAERPKKGKYHISIKEHRVYDLHETYLYCCSSCLINSKAFRGSLKEDRCSVLNPTKVNEILRLFKNVGLEYEEIEEKGKKRNPGSSKLIIKENAATKDGEVSMEEWIGPSNAIEGYVPQRDRQKGSEQGNTKLNEDNNAVPNGVDFEVTSSSREVLTNDKSYQRNNSETMESLLSDINFSSMIIINDEFTAPEKLDGCSMSGDSGARKGSKAKKSVPNNVNDSIFGGIDFMSTIITQDEYNISKLPSNQVISDSNHMSQVFSEKLNLGAAEKQFNISEVSTSPVDNGPQTSMDSAFIKAGNSVDQNAGSSKDTFGHDQNDATHSEKAVRSSQLKSKSSLKTSGVKKAARSVTWADEELNGLVGGNLCEYSESKNTKEGPGTSRSKETGENDDLQRFASAEACAMALIEAAEAVASGQSDVNDAVSEAGITVLPQPEPTGKAQQSGIDDEVEDIAPEKWPKKPANLDSEFFDADNSWIDGVPEGFSLTLSPFALMWDALFSWWTSSSLAYIYGREESFHEEYMSVNGREYPGKPVLPDPRSHEIKQTLASCLARALPVLIADLKLPTLVSTVERKLACLLDTMSFMDALPPFRMKQWQVVALLFIDALSVCRIPELTTHLTSRRVLFAKVLNGAQVSAEEYEIMKDLMIPLGRVPQFSMQSGG